MLKQRILTAVPLAAAFLAALFCLPFSAFAGLIGLLLLLAGWEWGALAGLRAGPRIAFLLVLALLLVALLAQRAQLEPRLFPLSLGLWIFLSLLVLTFPRSAPVLRGTGLRLGLAILVLAPAYLAVLVLYSAGPWHLLWALGVVWAADIGAYFAGRRFGKRKLAPAVSPGKSWEGALGGLACALLVSLAFAYALSVPRGAPLLLFTVLMAVLSIFGDLFESVLKRTAGVKDSGGLLPGHGGVLDRLDALLPALPLAALGLGALPPTA